MDSPSASIRDLASRLLALEAASQSGDDRPVAVRVLEKLRASLTRFAGADGFAALLRRALALARAEVPGLAGIKVVPGGCLSEPQEVFANAVASGIGGPEGAAAVTAYLLALLVAFIGEPLTERLVRDAWPDVALNGTSKTEAAS